MKDLVVAVAMMMVPATALAVTPVASGNAPGAPMIVNSSPGNQTDPHVSGDIAAYTDQSSGTIRYYDFVTTAPGSIFTPAGSIDQLSDVNGNHIAFARKTGGNRSCMVFDVTDWSIVQVGGDNSGAFSTALGNDTVAFVAFNDIKVGRISNPSGPLANLSSSAALDMSPAVSPSGNAVVWQACEGSGCSILKSTFNGSSWSSSVVVANAPSFNTSPDTDGASIAYDSDRAGSVDGSDIYLQSLSGGVDTQLSIAGAQRNPSIASGIVAFESTAFGASSADLFIYEVSSNRLFQLTDTATLDEQLNDVTVLGDGSIRVVWAAHPDSTPDNDIFAQTFTLPQELPLPDPCACKGKGDHNNDGHCDNGWHNNGANQQGGGHGHGKGKGKGHDQGNGHHHLQSAPQDNAQGCSATGGLAPMIFALLAMLLLTRRPAVTVRSRRK